MSDTTYFTVAAGIASSRRASGASRLPSVDARVGVTVRADREKIRHVLLNLIGGGMAVDFALPLASEEALSS